MRFLPCERTARLDAAADRVGPGSKILRVPVTSDEVCAFARTLPRINEGLVRGYIKFRIGRIVWLSLSPDGSTMGFAFPKDCRDALVEAEPEKFSLPSQGDMRYHWAHVRLAAIDADEMRELVEDAWAFCVRQRGGRRLHAHG